tara:strand:- start:1212 stop:1457 length:246 start_codon:yes stop_codon:yes gene_type:complete
VINFSLKTKISFYLSLAWLVFSFFIATTYSKLDNQLIITWFDFYNVYWHIFFIVGLPVWLYWLIIKPYNWLKKIRKKREQK